jgi:hypothetical protein
VNSGFRLGIKDISALTECYAEIVSKLLTFRDNRSVAFPKCGLNLEDGTRWAETSVTYHRSKMRNIPEERRYHYLSLEQMGSGNKEVLV